MKAENQQTEQVTLELNNHQATEGEASSVSVPIVPEPSQEKVGRIHNWKA